MANAAGSDDMLNRVMLRDNIGLASLLEVVPPSESFLGSPQHVLVANAHIHWDPEYRDVKLIQMVGETVCLCVRACVFMCVAPVVR